MRWVKLLAWVIVILFVLVPSVIYGLLATNKGSNLVLSQALKWSGQPLTIAKIEGDLLSELTLSGVDYQSPTLQISAKKLALNWQPSALIDQQLVINQIITADLIVRYQAATTEPTEETQPLQLPDISLPFELQVKQLRTENTQIQLAEGLETLPDVSLALNWHQNDLTLTEVKISHDNMAAVMNAQLDTTAPYQSSVTATWQLSQLPISAVALTELTGSTELVGNLNSLNAVTRFEAEQIPEQQMTIHAEQLLTDFSWQASLILNQLPLSLGFPLLQDSAAAAWLTSFNDAKLSATLDADPTRLQLHQLQINDIQSASKQMAGGSINATGVVSNYLDAMVKPNQTDFNVDLVIDNVAIEHTEQNFLIKQLALKVKDNLSKFSYELAADVTHPLTETVSTHLHGTGSLHDLAIESLSLTAPNFNALLAGSLNWKENVEGHLDVQQFTLDSQLIDASLTEQITAEGGLAFSNNRVSAEQFNLQWRSNKVQLDGAMRSDQPLLIDIQVPDISELSTSPYAQGNLVLKASAALNTNQSVVLDIAELSIKHPDFGDWASNKNGKLEVPLAKPVALTADDLCLQSNARIPAEICLQTAYSNQQQTTTITARSLPLALLNRFREADVAERVWGLVDADASLIVDTNSWSIVRTEGDIRSDRTFLFALDEEVSTGFKFWGLSWAGNLDLITSEITAELNKNAGVLIGDAEITNLADAPQLSGSVLLSLEDLTLLQWFLPDLRYENATALGSIEFSGPLAKPELIGSIELAADEIGFAESGLLLTGVRVNAQTAKQQPDNILLDGQAYSGDGWITIRGLIEPKLERLAIDIDGEKFRTIQTPEITVDVSPNITISLIDKRIDVKGEVTIPYANIEQPELGESIDNPSEDIKLYKDGKPVVTDESSIYPLYADIRVNLSEQISVSAFGFEGNLAGSLRLIEQPNRALTASGSVRVTEGFYELYGQRLEIDRGSLIYNGGSVDNPGLDLRVVRAKENIMSTENVTVGAQITGTLTEPDFQMFSTPAMPDSEVLSYLILGRGSGTTSGSGDNMQLQALIMLGSKGTEVIGQPLQEIFGLDEFGIDSTMNPQDTSFYIGKYLSPKLYVKYGVGLFENTNTFLIRYFLTDNILIESTASGEAQGGDIFYTIEK